MRSVSKVLLAGAGAVMAAAGFLALAAGAPEKEPTWDSPSAAAHTLSVDSRDTGEPSWD
ncbi:hypothetical protein ACF053_27425 [Streptomyces kanasensis]|uniref:hypothetical protein n=1 Tax=Streptomyces kanasensis TaxID=936756 RepID=UPI0037002025